MRLLTVGENEAGQRLDKLLAKYMDKAPASFFYKMLRKKNITLNGKRAEGKERLKAGDEIRLFLADETIDGFSGMAGKTGKETTPQTGSGLKKKLPAKLRPEILYEDKHVIFFNKPAGLLSQKAKPSDVSLVEYLTEHLLESGEATRSSLRSFRPGICNRLDRNTSGLVAAGKSLRGLQELNELFRVRNLHKYYRTIAVNQPCTDLSAEESGRPAYLYGICAAKTADLQREALYLSGDQSDYRPFPSDPRPSGQHRTSPHRRRQIRQSEGERGIPEKFWPGISASSRLPAGTAGAYRSSFESFGTTVYCAASQRVYERFEPWRVKTATVFRCFTQNIIKKFI